VLKILFRRSSEETILQNTPFKRNPQIHLTKELLVLALNSSTEAILIKDCDGIVLIGSQKVAEFLKCSVDDLPGRDSYEFLPKALAQSIRKRDQHVIATGQAESIEETWDLGYEQRTLLAARSPIRDSEGRSVGIITCYTNISYIKQAFLMFEQNEKRFSALAQTCPVGIFECDPCHQLSYVNPEWERITGLTSDEVVGKHWSELVSREQQPLVQHLQGNAELQPGGDRIDCTLEGKNSCTVELSLNRVSDTYNNTVSYIGSIVDLTYRLAAQQELREKASLMRDLTRSVPAIIWQLNMDGQCVFTSDYFSTITGEPVEAALGGSWENWIHEKDFPATAESIRTVVSGEQQTASHEFRMKGKDNEWRWMLSNCQQIHSMDGKPMGVAGHTIDITDRREAEEELQQSNILLERRVKERTQELLSVNDSLVSEIENRQHAEELLEEKRAQLSHFSRVSVMGRLSGELAHELNQPLNAIQNYVASLTQILTKSPVSEPASHVLSKLTGEITRAANIIRRTREFVSTGKHQPERLNMSELAAGTSAMLKGEARRRGMSISIVDEEKNSFVLGDPVRLQQVLVNLVLNALESMVDQPKSKKVAIVEIKSNSNRVWLTVHDSGSGVLASQRSRLFEAFFTTKSNGLGMGLAISRGIVEEHQGTLTYAPREGGGSSLIIELPSATDQ
jgi:PAS domain S-box-containing protein